LNNYKWVLCENKINTINEIMTELIDVETTEFLIVNLEDAEILGLTEYEIYDLREFIISEDIKLFKKVVDNDK